MLSIKVSRKHAHKYLQRVPLLSINRYGQHLCNNSYYISNNREATNEMFHRLRNYNGKSRFQYTYPKYVRRWRISSVQDVTMGYDSRTWNRRSVFTMGSSYVKSFMFRSLEFSFGLLSRLSKTKMTILRFSSKIRFQ